MQNQQAKLQPYSLLEAQTEQQIQYLIKQHLSYQQAHYQSYINQDFSKLFDLKQFQLRRIAKPNPLIKDLGLEYALMLEYYILKTLTESVGLYNAKFIYQKYLQTRNLTHWKYLNDFVKNALTNNWSIDLQSYQNYYQSRQEAQILRQLIRQSPKLTYNTQIFDQYVNQNYHIQLTEQGYEAFFQEYKKYEKQFEKSMIQEKRELYEAIPECNKWILQNYYNAATQYSIEPSVLGYCIYEKHIKEMYSASEIEFYHQKHQFAQQQKVPNKIVNQLSEAQIQFHQSLLGPYAQECHEQEVQSGIASQACKCCQGKVFDCQGDACQVAGQCVHCQQY